MSPREKAKERLRAKLQCPELFTSQSPDHCLPWPGKATKGGLVPRLRRDSENLPYRAAVFTRPYALTKFQGKQVYVHRLMFILSKSRTPKEFKAQQTCTTLLCVNPKHWVFSNVTRTKDLTFEDLPPPPPQEDEGWTLEEAKEFVDRYLLHFPHPPVDREHNLLIDVPSDLLTEAFIALNKGHLLE